MNYIFGDVSLKSRNFLLMPRKYPFIYQKRVGKFNQQRKPFSKLTKTTQPKRFYFGQISEMYFILQYSNVYFECSEFRI